MDSIKKRIGIIGGGQLGKMMIQEAKKMGLYITVLDPTKNCPAHTIVDEHIVAKFNDENAIRLLASKSDVITYEFEHIGADILERLENEGINVYPTAKSLKVIQNKFYQKSLLKENNINIPKFMNITNINDIKNAGKKYGYPFLLKSCTGGYDGKGNFLVNSEYEIEDGFAELGSGKLPLMAEKFFKFKIEISVLACRSINGDVRVYPVAENIHHNNILFQTRVPASISKHTEIEAMELAKNVMKVFDGVGMFCVEMFVDSNNNIVVNEVAPRPHNSGHYTIEACVTSQFEQHIRAISGFPLGSPKLLSPVAMVNLIGENGYDGDTEILNAYDVLKIDGLSLHIYGKQKCSPKRKMGHITVISDTLECAIKNSEKALNIIKIRGKNKI